MSFVCLRVKKCHSFLCNPSFSCAFYFPLFVSRCFFVFIYSILLAPVLIWRLCHFFFLQFFVVFTSSLWFFSTSWCLGTPVLYHPSPSCVFILLSGLLGTLVNVSPYGSNPFPMRMWQEAVNSQSLWFHHLFMRCCTVSHQTTSVFFKSAKCGVLLMVLKRTLINVVIPILYILINIAVLK